MSAVTTTNLRYIYGAGTPFEAAALDGTDFTAEEGAFIGIVGHTGSGKTTLVQHLNGLLKPTSGTVVLFGKDIWAKGYDIRAARFEAGLVFQFSEYQLFEETCYKDIAFGPKNMGLSDSEVDTRVKEAAAAMEVKDEWLTKSPFDLSGGEKRRVALAGVLAMQPRLLILDEPAAGLDPSGREMVLNRISKYRSDNNVTILLVSHSMEDIARFTDKVLVMSDGKVLLYGDTEDVFAEDGVLAEAGLALPQITRLALLLKRRGINIGAPRTVEEAAKRLLSL
ncbi:MAG: energy-coupling factor transporter ATPase [Oscillospiraceae bacterium]|nr:energy-coupling factor transporter ATPase [Oscillospiraceae bacterium]